MRMLARGTVSTWCLLLFVMTAYAGGPDRPNRGKELYSPPWSEQFVALARSCKNLGVKECAALRRLATMPHAHWVGLDDSTHQDLQDLHTVIRDAHNEKRVLTIVLYRLPTRDCGGGVPQHKKMSVAEYHSWIARVADAITYYKSTPINVIIEPGGLSNVITQVDMWCHGRTKRELLDERIELLRYVLWNIVTYNSKKKRSNPNLRLFIDVGGPGTISEPKAKIAMANALQKILKVAEADGIGVNVGGYASFDESRAWAKELLQLLNAGTGKKLTMAIDISRSGNAVAQGCNTPGAALDEHRPTLDHSDPKVELVTIIKDPSTSDGDGEDCNGGGPAGSFDLKVFREYLQNTARSRVLDEP